jgi:arylsulfatase A-like enzyme
MSRDRDNEPQRRPLFAGAIMKRVFLCLIGLLGLAVGSVPLRAVEDVKPNIVFFLADDMGFMDIGANNPRTFYETPNIDRLASSGMRFTEGHSSCPVCSPSRASLMTGKYPPRTGVTDYISRGRYTQGKLTPAFNQDHIALEEVTIAERLRAGGYATFLAGKWHLGDGVFSPNAQGFGPGLLTGKAGMFYYPPSDKPAPDPKVDPHTSDRIADEAVSFIYRHRDQPFCAYLPFLDVHTPLQAPADLVAKYERKKSAAPPDSWGQEGERKVRLVQNHAIYAAMVEQLDSAVGRVVTAIERAGLASRTIVIFTSDNGGLSTSEGHPTSNVPLRAGKGWPYEGGIRVPLIISAPGVTRPGSLCQTPVITTDFYPTLLELTSLAPAPEQHHDGVSIVPLLRGGEIVARTLFWHYPHYGNQGGAPCGFVRDGDWKLIEWYEDGRRELYNLRDDPGELRDLAATNPDRLSNLTARLATWRHEVNAVMPTPNLQWVPKSRTKGPAANYSTIISPFMTIQWPGKVQR